MASHAESDKSDRTALRNHPRYEAALASAMNRVGLPDYARFQLEKILSGEIDEASLQCCHSGCDPCNGDLLKCVGKVRAKLSRKRFWFF